MCNVLKRPLETHFARSQEGLTENQFCRDRSTMNAIKKLLTKIIKTKRPLRRRKLYVLISIDVANVFNIVSWKIIGEELN